MILVNKIRALYKGEERLSTAFWGAWIAVGGILILVFYLVTVVILYFKGINIELTILERYAEWFVSIYSSILGVLVWKCAENTNNKIWTYVARIIVFLVWVELGEHIIKTT